MIHIEGNIEADPDVRWNYHFENANVCSAPASTHVMLQIKNDDLTASDGRYWSNSVGLELSNGPFALNIPVTEGNWTNVDGRFNKDGFDKLLRSMGKVGFTFGGGCFFGHGVSVSGGKAMFYMTRFVIDPAERASAQTTNCVWRWNGGVECGGIPWIRIHSPRSVPGTTQSREIASPSLLCRY
jgi:hypothetical protein